jgi:hypothetical protein
MTGMPWKSEPMMEEEIDDPAFAIIEGDGGAEVICTVSELNLPKVQPGTRLEVMSYMNGAHSFAEVISVDDTPVSYTAQNWGDNPQNSSYQVHARLEEAGDFVIGNWVRVTLADSSSDPGNDISKNVFMPAHYVRQEGGDYYIMKQGEDGRLVKQYVRVGRNMYGYYLEITGGLNMKDKICFPYGKNVKEGVRTNETDQVLYPSSYY